MASHFSLLPNDSNLHTLLEPPAPAYSAATVRRALVVWLHCGQQNELRQVCNYFHRLEAMEEKLSVEDRVKSRLPEFHLLSSPPPTSKFLSSHFPTQYRHTKNSKINVKELQEITHEGCVFNLEGFYDLKVRRGVTAKDIIKTSLMIRRFSKTYSKPLRKLLAEFHDFAKKTKTTNSVDNIAMYIRKIYLRDELLLWVNMKTQTFSFMTKDEEEEDKNIIDEDSGNETEVLRDNPSPISTVEDHTFNANKNANKIKILINESRRKDLLNMIPNCQKVLAAKLSKMKKAKPDGGSL